MIPNRFDAITKADIESLLANRVREGRTIDYKLLLPGGSDSDKKELLADVSSFANAGGGDLLFGVEEDDGVPTEIPGLSVPNTDAEKLRFENILRSGLQPRIPGIQMKVIDGFSKGPVLLVRIPASWASPHAVTHGGTFRFYTRNSAGKYPMDVTELRAAFALSEALPERIRRFRDDRIGKIIAGETPAPLVDASRMVLHIVPVSAFVSATKFDLSTMQTLPLPPIQPGNGWTGRFNLDGFVTYSSDGGGCCVDYVQLFRTGVIEAVNSVAFSVNGTSPQFISAQYEAQIVQAVPRYFNVLRQLDISPPALVVMAMLGVKGLRMSSDYSLRSAFHSIDRDTLILPDVLVEDFSERPETFMKPVFDAVWQSAGSARSGNYDDKGNWKPRF